ncbi:preprotein translocase subunit YajC [Myxococcota bacterium]|nr:preprotein translocase subunit YajC [Myxococcota bacterium]
MLVPMGAIFLIFYFLILRPQHKQQRAQEDLRKGAAKGDEVVTVGGVHGRITGTTDDVLTVEIASLKGERVRIKVDRAKIDRVEKAAKGEES